MFLVPLIIAIFLFCPETTYLRYHIYDTDVLLNDHLGELADAERKAQHTTTETGQTLTATNQPIEKPDTRISQTYNIAAPPAKKTYLQSLAIYTGVYSADNLLKLFAAPFVTLLNTAALYTCVTSGVLQAWYVGTAIIQTQLFSAPPYLFNAAQIGYLSVGPLLGGTIGSALLAVISDLIAKWATIRNKGI
jgi:hypothetical protein